MKIEQQTLRDIFAGLAMYAILGKERMNKNDVTHLGETSYLVADKMLEARNAVSKT